MLDKSFGLLFYLKKPKNYERGPVPIYIRITVDGIPKELSTKRECDPNRWNTGAERASGTKEESKTLNIYLDTLQTKVYEAKRQLIESNKLVTAQAIKDILTGAGQRDRMLITIFREYNAKIKKLIAIDYSEATWAKYDRAERFTKEFVEWKYKTEDISLQSLNMEFINDLEFWYKTVRKCNQNTTVKYISILKMVVLFCVDNEWISKDPFARFSMKKEEVIPTFLTQVELTAIANKKFAIERLEQVRDVYIFCCYTGLSYIDVYKLDRNAVSLGVDNDLWIFTNRQKTDVPSRIPLLPEAKRILQKYEGHPHCEASGKLLPVLSNQKYNSYLKEIADLCGIKKTLTTHTARHTFGTTITLSNGVPIESVSKMLGHKKIQTTQHYARVLDNKISDDMQALKSKLEWHSKSIKKTA